MKTEKRKINANLLWNNVEYLAKVNDSNLSDLARRYYKLNDNDSTDVNIFYLCKNRGTTPSLERVIDIATILGVSIEDLLFTDFAKIDDDIKELEEMLAELKAKKGGLKRG